MPCKIFYSYLTFLLNFKKFKVPDNIKKIKTKFQSDLKISCINKTKIYVLFKSDTLSQHQDSKEIRRNKFQRRYSYYLFSNLWSFKIMSYSFVIISYTPLNSINISFSLSYLCVIKQKCCGKNIKRQQKN